jgi:hypothetical protein
MRERVRQWGELNVRRAEPGTLLEARIPLFGSNLKLLPQLRAIPTPSGDGEGESRSQTGANSRTWSIKCAISVF